MRPRAIAMTAVAGTAALVWAAACAGQVAGSDAHGKAIFASQCALCHGADGGGGQGPRLVGVVGRKAASTGFGYSQALRKLGWTWDAAHLDRFLASPAAAAPGTTMAMAVPDAADRRDLIAYLAKLKPSPTAAPPSPGPAAGDWRSDAPGRTHHIAAADLPAPFATPSAGNGSDIASRPPGASPQTPPGVRVEVFASGLDNPRQMAVAPNGDVFVAETGPGRVRVLRASDGAGKAAQTVVFASGLSGPFGMAFHPAGADPKWLYVAERNRVVRFAYTDGALKAAGPPEVVVSQLAPTAGGHTTRDLKFSSDGSRMFVSVGSGSNIAQEMPRKLLADAVAYDKAHGTGATWGPEANRADVLVFTPDGEDGRVWASGVRNCVGLAVQPGTGALWCSTNERDGLGDDLVPDYVTRVTDGAFYGWPWWYVGDHEEPRLKGERPDLKGRVTVPDVLLQAHSASLGLTFYEGAMFPEWRGSGLAAEHGSWNRSERTGPKLIRLPMNPDGSPVGSYEDVMTGFTVNNAEVWGRPVGVAVAHDGAILVSDDAGGVVWRLSKAPAR